MAAPALTDALEREVGGLVGRLRGFSLGRFAAAAPPFRSRGAVAFHLVEVLATLAGIAEGVTVPAAPRLGDHALADQLAVLAYDLLAALAARPDDAVATAALAEVVLHRRDLDGSPPGRETVAVLATALRCEETPGAVLLAATGHCPAFAG